MLADFVWIGVAFQGSAPWYRTDGESRIMISKALSLLDRLSGCASHALYALVAALKCAQDLGVEAIRA